MREVVVSVNEVPDFRISEVVLFWERASPRYGHGRGVAEVEKVFGDEEIKEQSLGKSHLHEC